MLLQLKAKSRPVLQPKELGWRMIFANPQRNNHYPANTTDQLESTLRFSSDWFGGWRDRCVNSSNKWHFVLLTWAHDNQTHPHTCNDTTCRHSSLYILVYASMCVCASYLSSASIYKCVYIYIYTVDILCVYIYIYISLCAGKIQCTAAEMQVSMSVRLMAALYSVKMHRHLPSSKKEVKQCLY